MTDNTREIGGLQKKGIIPILIRKGRNNLQARTLRRYSLILIIGFIWLAFQLLTGGTFLSQRNLTLLALQTSITGITTVGAVLLIITRNFDLSIGSVLELLEVVIAVLTIRKGWGVLPTISIAMVLGIAIGVWQGWWVARLGVPSFIVSLAGMLYFRGMALTISDANTIAPVPKSLGALSTGYLEPLSSIILISCGFLVFSLYSIRRAYRAQKLGLITNVRNTAIRSLIPVGIFIIAAGYVTVFRGIPYLVLLFGVVALVGIIITTNTKFGQQIYAVGSNPEAARLSGIDPSKTIFKVWIFEGVIYGIAAIALTSRITGAIPGSGVFMELDAIASAIIGGTSLAGGSGTVLGGILGALLMKSLDNGMGLLNVKSFYQYISKGAVLLFAVFLDLQAQKAAR
jgi:D-xylose transport system permease protein